MPAFIFSFMNITSGLLPFQVLQRNRQGLASARLRGLASSRADGEVRATVLTKGTPLRGFSDTPVGRCRRGRWQGTLARLPVGGPYDVVLRVGSESVTVRRILVGDVWVMAGQSNMVGDGQIAQALRPHPLVHAFYSWDEWRLAVEPVHVPSASKDPCHYDKPITNRADILRAHKAATKGTGPGLAFARAMLRRTGVPQGLIPCAAGGTSMEQWTPSLKSREGRSLYGAMLRRFRLQGQPVAGVLWYQGEAEISGDATTYTARMRKLVASVRRDFRNASLPWIMVQLGKTHLFSPEESEQATLLSLRDQQRLLPRHLRNLSVVPAIDLPMEDGIHIAAEGQNILGERLARAAAYRLGVPGATAAIELKRLRLVPCPDNWGQCPAIEVEFANVAGDLRSDGVPTGFRLIKPDGTLLKRIHKVLFKGGGRLVVVPYTYPDFTMKGYRLAYGYDLDAYCNIHDAENMSLPAFAPQPIEGAGQGGLMKGKNKRMNMRLGGVLAVVVLMAMNGRAEKLAPDQWKVTDEASGKKVTTVTDNRLETSWTASGDRGLLIDLGQPTVLHRLYLAPGGGITNSYRQVTISFMTEPAGAGVVHRYMTPTSELWKVSAERAVLRAGGTNDFLPSDKPEADLRFNPIVARYLHIDGAIPLAEVMAYGSAAKAAFDKDAAVVVAPNAPTILRIAAEDLRYYIGELTGRPLPIVAPGQEGAYPGTLYRIVDLSPLATNYEQMAANTAAGKLPNTAVNVEKQGREVLFKAWPHINVAHSVWEFLRQQGVTWAAPEDHADYVPVGKGVDLSRLPLRKSPSAKWREGLGGFSHGPVYWACFYMDDTLFALRNGSEVGRLIPGLGAEMPANADMQLRVTKAADIKPEYREGFEGHPHNLHSVIPNRLLESNPEWCGMGPDGQRKPPSKGGPQTFCFTSPEVITFVADKMVYWSGDNTNCAATFRLVPTDGASFCICARCLALCQPLERPVMAYCAGDHVMSGPYYYFITEVAKRVKVLRPKLRVLALAYSDYTPVPRAIPTFPDNITMQVCTYGQRNLPLTAPANAATRAYLEPWTTRGVPLSHWDYLLIHSEWRTLTMPAPMVTATVDREQYLARLGMLDGLTQTDGKSFTHNPWNFYAFGRTLWDVSLTADRILDEFFTAYYQEAKAPMLAYYSALESHLIRNSVSLEDFAYDLGPNPAMFTPELIATLRKHLANARAAATTYYVKARVDQAASDLEWAIPAAGRRSMDKAVALKNGKKEYVCPRRAGAIVVDGKLDDEGWKGVATAGGFAQPGTFEPVKDKDRTEFRMTWDDAALYVAVRCANTNAANLKVTENVWGMDNFEFFFVPAASYTAGYYQAVVSAGGQTWGPQHFMGDYMWGKDPETLPKFAAAVQRGDGEWTCEFVVPFKTLKDAAPKAGDFWRANMARGGASWSRLPIGNWHLYRDFDLVTFAGEN